MINAHQNTENNTVTFMWVIPHRENTHQEYTTLELVFSLFFC